VEVLLSVQGAWAGLDWYCYYWDGMGITKDCEKAFERMYSIA
jgi:hypothetical protein